MFQVFAALMTVAGVVLAGLAGYVAWRHGTKAGLWLAVLLLAAGWWGLAYAVELSVPGVAAKTRWGDLKYVGVCALPPAWLLFVLHYTARGRVVSRRLVMGLTVEPVLILALLANGPTHDLVRYYQADPTLPVATGPAFWAHLVYSYTLILFATGLFVLTMVRLSRTYRRMAIVLVGAALFPWAANLLHNFELGWFAQHDLTPFLFTITGGVLVWGLFRERLVNLSPLARSVIVETMDDGVVVLDAFGRIADLNPAAARVLGSYRSVVIGLPLADLLPQSTGDEGHLTLPSAPETSDGPARRAVHQRAFDVRRQPLIDRNGRPAGELVVLRDITDRVRAQERLQELLVEQSRVAGALQASLVPHHLPAVPSSEIANRYEPAGDGSEIGGDFFDIFALGDDSWGLVLGDVSGKGAEAAAVTALARYTLRALAQGDHSPSRTLRELNSRLLADTDVERHCTLVYAVARPTCHGMDLTVSLAGHHPPLVVRSSGAVEPVGHLGTALGLVDEPDLHDIGVELLAGDLICMFTDGLVEARDGSHLFGTDRVAEILAGHVGAPAEEVADELVHAARRFHHGHDLSDDLALLVVRAHGADRDSA